MHGKMVHGCRSWWCFLASAALVGSAQLLLQDVVARAHVDAVGVFLALWCNLSRGGPYTAPVLHARRAPLRDNHSNVIIAHGAPSPP